jgi:hypothetical protein
VLSATAAAAQEPEPVTRQATVVEEQAQKVAVLHPYTQTATERLMVRVEDMLVNRTITWHPFFESAAHGGGLPLGVGYMLHVSPYNHIDVRGSYSVAGYRRAEAEFVAPRLFERRGSLSVIGGWRDANQIAFYGLGSDSSIDNRANYGVKEGFGSALLTVWPLAARRRSNASIRPLRFQDSARR